MPGSQANRRLPLACLVAGLSSLAFVGVIAAFHYGFGMPLRDKSTGVALDPSVIRMVLMIIGVASGGVAAFGAALMIIEAKR